MAFNKQPSNEKRVRISLDLSARFNERLEALEKLIGAESKASLIRKALEAYEYIAWRTREGYSFRAVSPDGKEEERPVFLSPYEGVAPARDRELVARR